MTNLVQRRFVACMYDVAPPGKNAGDAWAYDEDAAKAIGPIDELRRGRGGGGTQGADGRVRADSYPAALFLLPDGTRLGDGLWGILPPEAMVRELQAVIARWPHHFPPGDEEVAVLQAAERAPDDAAAALAAARLCFELAEFERVLPHCVERVLERATKTQRAELLYLRGRALRCLHRDNEARQALLSAEPEDADLADAVQVLLARLDMHAREFHAALARLTPIVERTESRRWTGTAMYYAGLCHHRRGDETAAKRLWRRHREELPFDRMARRSAGSLGLKEAEAFLNQELLDTKGWW